MEEFDYFGETFAAERPKNANGKIPVERVIEKLDDFLSRNDYSSAEKHLLYWLSEAKELKDVRGEFAVSNELMGLYRKTGKKDEAYKFAVRSLELAGYKEIKGSSSEGTAMLNAATVYKAFGEPEKAALYYETAKNLYEKLLTPKDVRFAGLYNNYALALVDIKRFTEAEEYYDKALEILSEIADGEPEAAITELNKASLIEARDGLEAGEKEIEACAERAAALLDKTTKRDGNYAFVCEKCSPVFGYYGYFLYEAEYMKRAKAIYERA